MIKYRLFFLIGILLVLLFGSTLLFCLDLAGTNSTQSISQWEFDGQAISLPRTLSRLAPRSSITLTARILPEDGDYLYLKTVYMPLKVYADGQLIYEYGQIGSYPAFLLDPPTAVALIALPHTGRPVTLEMEYLFPTQRRTATLHPVLMGTSGEIFVQLLSQMGFSLFFSIVLITMGILLSLVAPILIRVEKSGISFFWLGLFSFCVGIWVLGECNLTGIFIKNPPILYLMAFTGLFTFVVPLIRFGLIVINFHESKLLLWNCFIVETAVSGALLLQLLGIMALSRSMYLFHVLVPMSLALFSGCILFESIRYQNPMARRFFLPMSVLGVAAFLEVNNYYLFHLPVQKSFFFQLGVLVFIVMVSVICGYFIQDMFVLKLQNQQLAYEISLMEKQIEVQTERYQLFAETSARIRQQRHDLRHHIAVIRDYLHNQECSQLTAYLDKLYADIPENTSPALCENQAVNAIALHYQAMARKAGIDSCSICLDIPKNVGEISDNELCVIVGNLLENAIAACEKADSPFIRMKSRLADQILTITMDNSCGPVEKLSDGSFRSSKKEGGIGLISVRSVAKRHNGNSRFETQDGVFYSSVYLHLFKNSQGIS